MVLPACRQGMPDSAAATTSAFSSVRLRRRLCELASRLVRAEEDVVLPASGQGLRPTATSAATISPLRLQRWLRKLAGRLVSGKKVLVLPACRQGLPSRGARLWWHDVCTI